MRRSIKNVMAVGDDAQSIYSFRAATVRNMLDFPKIFLNRSHHLEQNYRSSPHPEYYKCADCPGKGAILKNLFSTRRVASVRRLSHAKMNSRKLRW